jgi:hypothetical protein
VIDRSPMYLNYGPGALLENDTRLDDLSTDPDQQRPMDDPPQETRLAMLMAQLMTANQAPPEAFRRLDLAEPSPVLQPETQP